jgi:hypothetical protein
LIVAFILPFVFPSQITEVGIPSHQSVEVEFYPLETFKWGLIGSAEIVDGHITVKNNAEAVTFIIEDPNSNVLHYAEVIHEHDYRFLRTEDGRYRFVFTNNDGGEEVEIVNRFRAVRSFGGLSMFTIGAILLSLIGVIPLISEVLKVKNKPPAITWNQRGEAERYSTYLLRLNKLRESKMIDEEVYRTLYHEYLKKLRDSIESD